MPHPAPSTVQLLARGASDAAAAPLKLAERATEVAATHPETAAAPSGRRRWRASARCWGRWPIRRPTYR